MSNEDIDADFVWLKQHGCKPEHVLTAWNIALDLPEVMAKLRARCGDMDDESFAAGVLLATERAKREK